MNADKPKPSAGERHRDISKIARLGKIGIATIASLGLVDTAVVTAADFITHKPYVGDLINTGEITALGIIGVISCSAMENWSNSMADKFDDMEKQFKEFRKLNRHEEL